MLSFNCSCRFVAVVGCVAVLLIWPGLAGAEDSRDGLARLRKKMTPQTQPSSLSGIWYGPRKSEPGKKYPLALILASKDFPVKADDYWIHTLWLGNYNTLVLRCPQDRWKNVSVSQIIRQIAMCPGSIPANANRLMLICDRASASLSMRFMDGYPDDMLGIVLISAAPVELTGKGLNLWSPRPACWSVPIWAVVGTRPKDAAKVLEMWRRLASYAPAGASLTIDTRIGCGVGHLLPDESILSWLRTAAAGGKPKPGPDRQAEAERKRFALVAEAVAKGLQKRASLAPVGETLTKTEGPFAISFVSPAGWDRDPAGERPYNPLGLAADQAGLPLGGQKNQYSEIYVTPKRRGPLFARICAAQWRKSSAKLLDNYNFRLARKGYLHASVKRWRHDGWAFEISSVMLPWRGKWACWLTLAAARGGSDAKPAGTLVLVMDASGKTDATAMAGAMKRICQSVKTDWTDSRKKSLSE